LRILTKIILDTGAAHHYLPSSTAESLFTHPALKDSFSQIHFVTSHQDASPDTDSGWLQKKPIGDDPVYMEFAGSSMRWPISLSPLPEDRFASIHASAQNRAILGMAFLSTLDGIIFDFTKGKERIGLITSQPIPPQLNQRNQRLLQFLVGTSLALIFVGGYKWYYNDKTE
jgi:hypothetical protein